MGLYHAPPFCKKKELAPPKPRSEEIENEVKREKQIILFSGESRWPPRN